jgi:hypothetical protein
MGFVKADAGFSRRAWAHAMAKAQATERLARPILVTPPG